VNGVDLLLLGIFAFAVQYGFQRGFLRQVAALGSVVLGIAVANRHHEALSSTEALRRVAQRLGPEAASAAAYVGLFAGCVLGGLLAASLLRRAIKDKPIEHLDSLAGGALALLKSYAVCGVVLYLLLSFAPLGVVKNALRSSYLAPRMAGTVRAVIAELPWSYRKHLRELAGAKSIWEPVARAGTDPFAEPVAAVRVRWRPSRS